MSVHVTRAVWEAKEDGRLEGIGGTDLLVLLALADFARKGGICWPGVARLALRAGVSERSAQRALGALKDAGVVRIVEPARGRRTPRYMVEVEGRSADAPAGRGDTGVTPASVEVTRVSPNPLEEQTVKSGGDPISTALAFAKNGRTAFGAPPHLAAICDAALVVHEDLFGRVFWKGDRAAWIKWASKWHERAGESVAEIVPEAGRLHYARKLAYSGPWSIDWAIEQTIFQTVDIGAADSDNHLRPFGVILE